MKPGNTHVIRVKKRGGHGHGGGHGGAWEVGYADLLAAPVGVFLGVGVVFISPPPGLAQIAG